VTPVRTGHSVHTSCFTIRYKTPVETNVHHKWVDTTDNHTDQHCSPFNRSLRVYASLLTTNLSAVPALVESSSHSPPIKEAIPPHTHTHAHIPISILPISAPSNRPVVSTRDSCTRDGNHCSCIVGLCAGSLSRSVFDRLPSFFMFAYPLLVLCPLHTLVFV
jgi:hypothetical protein